mgnify:CR=1 FL=1
MTEETTRWQTTVAAVEAEVRAWRAAHPAATLTEIERALDARLDRARAELLADVAAAVPEADARCPDCGAPMARRGERTRTLRTEGDAALTLTRAYLTCPACGRGLFPPG